MMIFWNNTKFNNESSKFNLEGVDITGYDYVSVKFFFVSGRSKEVTFKPRVRKYIIKCR